MRQLRPFESSVVQRLPLTVPTVLSL